jgi:hypothetical protein
VANPQYPETLWEELQVPGVVPLLGQIRDDLASMLTAIQDVTGELKAVAGALAAIPTATAGGTTTGGRLPVPLPALTLPISPKILNEMLNAANIPGVSKMGVWKLDVTVPAGSTVEVTFPVLPGTVHVFMAPLGVSATFYSDLISADVDVDGMDVTPSPYEYPITGADEIELGQYFYMRTGMQARITNGSTTTTTITFAVQAMAIQKDFFESLYPVILNFGVNLLRELAAVIKGAA